MSRSAPQPRAVSSEFPVISVITPVHLEAVDFLPTAAASLAQQKIPLRWVVCFDGEEIPGSAHDIVDSQCRSLVPMLTLLASGRQAGPATARTVALGHVATPWTATLDADDVWLSGGLDALHTAAARTRAAWCAGQTVDLIDGRRVAFPDHLPDGAVAQGDVFSAFERLGFLPFVGAAMVWRTEILWELGGWPALPGCEDTALVLAASERHPGHYVGGQPVYGYTKYAGQSTSLPRHTLHQRIAATHHYRRVAAIRNVNRAWEPVSGVVHRRGTS